MANRVDPWVAPGPILFAKPVLKCLLDLSVQIHKIIKVNLLDIFFFFIHAVCTFNIFSFHKIVTCLNTVNNYPRTKNKPIYHVED